MLLLMLACQSLTEGAATLPAPTVAVATDQTLSLDVRWPAVDVEALWLERTLPDGHVLTDAIDPAGGAARAHGHPALSVVSVRLVTGDGHSDAVEVETGNLIPALPAVDTSGSLGAPGELLLVSTFQPSSLDTVPAMAALDHHGQIVWYQELDHTDAFVADHRAEASGWRGLITATSSGDTALNTLTLWGWDGAVVEQRETPQAHHVFAESPEGLAWMVEETREIAGTPWIGDALLVDGDERFSVWDDLELSALLDNTVPEMGRRCSHTNGLQYSDARAQFVLTLAAQEAVLELDAATGAPVRWLGSPLPEGIDLEAATWAPEEAMAMPHMAAWTDDGTLLLTGSSDDFSETWATEFAVNGDTLEVVWTHGRGEGLGTPALGHAERLAGGDTLVNYGTRGVLQRVTPAGEVTGEVSVGLGTLFARAVPMGPIPLQAR